MDCAAGHYVLACLRSCYLPRQVSLAMNEPIWKQMEAQLERQGQDWPPKVSRVLRVLANQEGVEPTWRARLLREAVDAELAS